MAKVLIIDGNQDDLNSISVSLSKFIPGCVVSSAQSRAEGIRKAQAQLPDLVLLDIVLAEMDDFELCKLVKAEVVTKNTPIIVLTNPETGPGCRAKALDAGVAGFLVKPVDEAELKAQINTAYRKKKVDDIQRKKRELLKTVAQERTRALQKRTHDLTQRIKELNCLYGISALREKPGTTLEEILQGVTDLIPPSWQYPEITCARVIMGYQEFRTKNFRETPWKQVSDIIVHGEWAGTLEVYYLERPEGVEELFPEEERHLLNAIAERLGRIAERVQADDALRLESENIVNILKSMEDWIYIVNEQYEIEYINPALRKELGPAEGRKCYDYFGNREDICPLCVGQGVFTGKTVHWEWNLSRNNKTYDVVSTPTRNPDGSVSRLSILRDLTALKKTQKALEEREVLYRSLTESVADGVVLVQDGIILFVNNAFVDMFDFTGPEEVAGMEVVQLFDSEFRGLFRKVFDPQERDADIGNLLWGMCVTKEGKTIWVSKNRSVIRLKSRPAILATMRDITEQVHWTTAL